MHSTGRGSGLGSRGSAAPENGTSPPRSHPAQTDPGASPYNSSVHATDPTVLWRLTRGPSTAHATIFPGEQTTVTWFVDGVMDRAENYDTLDLAMARAEQIRGVLVGEGWKEP